VFASFKINQEYIARNLCVEKDIEGSDCRGCCQLKKKVNEQQEQKQQLPQTQEQKNNINFCHHHSSILMLLNQAGSNLLIYQYNNYKFQKYYSIFRPPQLAIK
jgi:hypothetical protein